MYNNTGYAVLDFALPFRSSSVVGNMRYINPAHALSAGFQLGGFLSDQLDIQLRLFFHNHSASDSVSSPEGGILSVPFVFQTPDDSSLASSFPFEPEAEFASSTLSANMNSFSLLIRSSLSHRFALLKLHAYAGLDISRVKTRQVVFYDKVGFSGSNNNSSFIDFKEKTAITGIGPLVGSDIEYPLFHNFSISGEINVAFLMGRHYFSVEYIDKAFVNNMTITGTDLKLGNRVFHSFEKLTAKLGLQYKKSFTHSRLLHIELTLGYRITQYLHLNSSSFNYPEKFQFYESLQHILGNTGFHGPFLSLTLVNS